MNSTCCFGIDCRGNGEFSIDRYGNKESYSPFPFYNLNRRLICYSIDRKCDYKERDKEIPRACKYCISIIYENRTRLIESIPKCDYDAMKHPCMHCGNWSFTQYSSKEYYYTMNYFVKSSDFIESSNIILNVTKKFTDVEKIDFIEKYKDKKFKLHNVNMMRSKFNGDLSLIEMISDNKSTNMVFKIKESDFNTWNILHERVRPLNIHYEINLSDISIVYDLRENKSFIDFPIDDNGFGLYNLKIMISDETHDSEYITYQNEKIILKFKYQNKTFYTKKNIDLSSIIDMRYSDYENPKIQIISENCSLIVKGVRFSKYGLLCSEGCGRAECNMFGRM